MRRQFPDDREMWAYVETIDQSLTRSLRSGRSLRQPDRYAGLRESRIVRDMVNIAQPPADADDRAVPVTGRATC